MNFVPRVHKMCGFRSIYLPLVPGYEPEMADDVAGEPAVDGRRDVHDPTLHAGGARRLDHLVQQQLRQQKVT